MKNVFVAECDLGRGLFAGNAFEKGDEILRFEGSAITLADTIAKGDEQGNSLQIETTIYLDLVPPGVFVNHSCDPNTGIMHDRVLVALRPIAAGEELRFDYSTTMWEDSWTMQCRCGSLRCRGVIGNFHELPIQLQGHYLNMGVVQKFIACRVLASGME